MDEQKCFVIGKPTFKNFKNDHDIVKYSIELRNLKEEAKDEDEESGIDDDESHLSGGALSQSLENKMAAADCAKSQDSSTDTVMPVKMQGLKEFLDKASRKPLIKEETWYLVDSGWYKQLKKYLGCDGSSDSTDADRNSMNHPGPVDNGPLFKENPETPGDIRDGLVDQLEYVLLPIDGWNFLVDEFGLTSGQEPIARKVIEQGKIRKHCKVEVYFTTFALAENSRPSETVKKKFSKNDTLATIQKTMRELFHTPDNVQTRLWTKYTERTFELLNNLEATVQDSSLFHDQLIIIDKQNSEGSWERQEDGT